MIPLLQIPTCKRVVTENDGEENFKYRLELTASMAGQTCDLCLSLRDRRGAIQSTGWELRPQRIQLD
jgi:hypothetical protein